MPFLAFLVLISSVTGYRTVSNNNSFKLGVNNDDSVSVSLSRPTEGFDTDVVVVGFIYSYPPTLIASTADGTFILMIAYC
mmetsp:Transcript_31265/g.35984  ORF Transcript_31265/g.35984 Transcript_31265/m.35984 type:complete len:80 (+) Transcript_31265:117-356(+)